MELLFFDYNYHNEAAYAFVTSFWKNLNFFEKLLRIKKFVFLNFLIFTYNYYNEAVSLFVTVFFKIESFFEKAFENWKMQFGSFFHLTLQ